MRSRLCILITISVLASSVGAYVVAVYFFTDYLPSDRLISLYQFLIVVLAAWYVVSENREHRYVYEPYELGMFVWLAWPAYMPYYLFRSRGLKGILIFVGLMALVSVEWIVSLAWYAFASGDA